MYNNKVSLFNNKKYKVPLFYLQRTIGRTNDLILIHKRPNSTVFSFRKNVRCSSLLTNLITKIKGFVFFPLKCRILRTLMLLLGILGIDWQLLLLQQRPRNMELSPSLVFHITTKVAGCHPLLYDCILYLNSFLKGEYEERNFLVVQTWNCRLIGSYVLAFICPTLWTYGYG